MQKYDLVTWWGNDTLSIKVIHYYIPAKIHNFISLSSCTMVECLPEDIQVLSWLLIYQ